ncbi:MAG: crotonase/enoyl-CoA hydratase family protein [Planktomarina sp.]
MKDLSLNIADGIATVTLNRPEKKNALSQQMFEGLPELAEQIEQDKTVRVVILTGAGTDFSAGIDLALLQSFLPKMSETRAEMAAAKDGPNWFQRPVTCWSMLSVPVIAVIQGVCFGGGMQLALGADFRIAAPDAKLSIMEAKWGLIPDMGITQSLPKLMGADQAKRLMMTGTVISGTRAAELNLVTEVSDGPIDAALELAATLMTRSPESVAAAKRLVDESWTMRPDAGLALEGELQASLIGTPNQMEAVMAGMTKKAPNFK